MKKLIVLFAELLLIAALAVGCASDARFEEQVDSIQIVKLSWSHPDPCDDNTCLFTDADQVQWLIHFFTELNYQEKYETYEEMWEANVEVVGNVLYSIDFMANGESVKQYIIHEIEYPMCIQFEPDGKIYQMAEDHSQQWKAFVTDLFIHHEFKTPDGYSRPVFFDIASLWTG